MNLQGLPTPTLIPIGYLSNNRERRGRRNHAVVGGVVDGMENGDRASTIRAGVTEQATLEAVEDGGWRNQGGRTGVTL